MKELKILETGIVPVYADEEARALINARELHEFLDIGKKFSDWVRYRIEQYGFFENEDFFPILGKTSENGGRPAIEYFLTIDMAKELSMVENNLKGRQIRRYFIACEKRIRAANGIVAARDAEKLRLRTKCMEIMERNARSRQAQILRFVAEFFKDILSEVSMRALAGEITLLVSGKHLVEFFDAESFLR
jgi:phage anti-repressor protein